MSIEAMTWVLKTAPVPDGRDATSLTMVLLGLANHADADGRHAFPSVARLAGYGRMSGRTVQRSLQMLEQAGLIVRGNQAIAAAHIERQDRRPVVYDLVMRDDVLSPRPKRGDNSTRNGVTTQPERGDVLSPETSLNHQKREPSEHVGSGALFAVPEKSSRAVAPAEFQQAWDAIGRRGSRKKAETNWAGALARLGKDRNLQSVQEQAAVMLERVRNYAANEPREQYRKHFERFLSPEYDTWNTGACKPPSRAAQVTSLRYTSDFGEERKPGELPWEGPWDDDAAGNGGPYDGGVGESGDGNDPARLGEG